MVTDGVGDAALAAADAGAAGAEAAGAAGVEAGEAAGAEAAEAAAADGAGDVASQAAEDAEETAADAESSVGQRAAQAARNGVTKGARVIKGVGKSAVKRIIGSPLKTLLGSVLIADGIGTITSGGYAAGSDAAGGVTAEKHWRNLLKAAVKSSKHPIAQYDSTSPIETYRNTPSMIMTCVDGEENCFRPVAAPTASKFEPAGDDDDKWGSVPGMLPTQTFASQIGCHTVFENDFGNFKDGLTAFQAPVFETTISQTQTTYPRITYQVIPSSIVRSHTGGALYHAGNTTHTYDPIVERRYNRCSMCALFTGYSPYTPPVDACTMPMPPDGTTKKMRYKIKDNAVYDYEAADKLADVQWDKVNKVTMTFRSGGEQTRTWTKGTPDSAGAVAVQRLLGRNLTSQGSPLDRPGCLGETSSLTSSCEFDVGLRVKPTQDIQCIDNTSTFTGACINPMWANDRRIIFPSNRAFDRNAELVSYCANVFSSGDGGELFSDAFYDTILTSQRGYQPLYNSSAAQFVQCANDRLSIEERIDFCKGSATALSGSAAVLGLRAAGRTDISQVCNFVLRQCIIYPEDPGGWTISRVVEALKDRGVVDEPFTLLYVPVAFGVVVNVPIYATAVATTLYNSPENAKADAFAEAAAREPVFTDINVTWSASDKLVQGMCPPGGPRVSQQATYFGLLWAILEGMSADGQAYTVISFDGLAQNKRDQRTVYSRAKVYPTMAETEIKTGLQKFVIRSAFDKDAGAAAAAMRPQLAGRFSPIDLVFAGDPPKGAAACTRFLTEAELTLSGVEFRQDSAGCLALPIGRRAPVIATGQSVGGTLFHYTKCRGCPAHGLVARGLDTSVYRDRVSENVDVGGSAMVGTTLRLAWPDGDACSDRAMACSNLNSFSGIALALARTQGDAEVVGCPAAGTSGRCYAEAQREPTYIVYANEKDRPMFSWYTRQRPAHCSNNATGYSSTVCFQGYQWDVSGGNWTGTSLVRADVPDASFPMINENRIVNESVCVTSKAFQSTSANSSDPGEHPVLLTIDDMYRNGSGLLVPPWFGFDGATVAIDSQVTVANETGPSTGKFLTLLVDHGKLAASATGRMILRGDAMVLNNTIYFVYSYTYPVAANRPGRLQLADTIDLTEAHAFNATEFPNGTQVRGARTEALEPCAPESFVVFSDGAVFRGDSADAQAAKYALISSLTHKCSAVGCLGGIDTQYSVPRCASAFPMDYTADGGRFFFWYGTMTDTSAEIFGVKQDGSPGTVGLGWAVKGGEAIAGTATRMLEPVGGTGDKCYQRPTAGDSTRIVTARPCDALLAEQQWLLVGDGPFFRVEVPGDPYTCIFRNGTGGGDAILAPCPACAVGSGSLLVGLPDPAPKLPRLVDPAPVTTENRPSVQRGAMAVPLSLDNPRLFLEVNTTSGMCMCAGSPAVYNCSCNLLRITKEDVVGATGDAGVCKHAIGPLLAACDKFGGGLAAVDGYKAAMTVACLALEKDPTRRFAGDQEGRGAMFECSPERNMLHVIDPGDYFVDGEEIVGLGTSGISAVVSKVYLQPYDTAIPSVVTAPYSLEVNVTDLLAPFGGTIHQLAVQSFSTEASIWAGVIIEMSIIGAVVLLQVCLLSRPASQVETAMTKVSMRMAKKNE